MKKADLESSALYINRELSWLEFNDRVLREGLREDIPLLERLKFLAIVSSNLDEFFMIRVGGLKQQLSARLRKRDLAGLTPGQQLRQIVRRVRTMVADQDTGIRHTIEQLREHDVALVDRQEWTDSDRKELARYFRREVLPVLTPLALEKIEPAPMLVGLRVYIGLVVQKDGSDEGPFVAAIPLPGCLPRLVALTAKKGLRLAKLDDVVAAHAAAMFPGHTVLSAAAFRITRDADVPVDDDEGGDLLVAIEKAVHERMRRSVVRLEIAQDAETQLKEYLTALCDVRQGDIFAVAGLVDARALWELVNRNGLDQWRYPDWPPQPPQDLIGSDDIYATLRRRDVMLFHPYESFDPVVTMLEQAAEDSQVMAIKQTLYRTASDSPIVAALETAARNKKQVTVLVELKARFDEQQNVDWARRLEEAGCDVIYGISGHKTHVKALLIVRRESTGIRRYAHLGTGNYHDKTAKLYSDLGLMTADRQLTADVSAFFNILTGYSEPVGLSKLSIAPTGLHRRVLEMIAREINAATRAEPGLIMIKANSLQDPEIIRGLYRASRAGVRVRLNIRGICCLRPGLAGVSENIEVVSIIDRFLEHARIFYFRNAGSEEVYLSSADLMTRNLHRRLEFLFPVESAPLQRRLVDTLQTYFSDTVKASRLEPDGHWHPVPPGPTPLRAQEALYRQARQAKKHKGARTTQFLPVRKKRR